MERRAMSNLVRGLDRVERLILMLRHCDNLQWREIADLLCLSEIFVMQTYVRVLKDQMRCVA
jgi:DNA-directed RNA polymerase specialized sigma24 family protein